MHVTEIENGGWTLEKSGRDEKNHYDWERYVSNSDSCLRRKDCYSSKDCRVGRVYLIRGQEFLDLKYAREYLRERPS